jgi:hypothetical protein
LRQIEDHAFANTGLRSIRIPSSHVVISQTSFSQCKSFRKIKFETTSK